MELTYMGLSLRTLFIYHTHLINIYLKMGKKITRVAEYPGMRGRDELWNLHNQISTP